MGDLASQFSTSFDNIISEISLTRTYAEQEQIYKGFIKLIQLQRKFLVARKELAAKLKDSVDKPLLIIKDNNSIIEPQLTQAKQNQLSKKSELPKPQSQLPETVNTVQEDKIKSKLRIKTVTKNDLDIEEMRGEVLPTVSSSLSSNTIAESPTTDIPATEIYSIKEKKEKRNNNSKEKIG
jgi:hypothetical protein